MFDDDARAVRALEDVVAVEQVARGLSKVVTWSDVYHVDAREGCQCEDKQYNLGPGERCKHEISALMNDVDYLPSPWIDETSAGTPTVMTDGGVQVPPEVAESDAPYLVVNQDDGNVREFDTEGDAVDARDTVDDLGGNAVIFGEGYADLPDADGQAGTEPDTVEADAEVVDVETVEENPPEPDTETLPDRSVGDDPIEWLQRAGGQFVDEIDNTMAINRRGFEVLSHFYDIDVYSDLEVAPEENGHEYVRVKATAVTAEGRECEAFGSAHVDRGDDPELLLEMADTRARKRALSIATGVGAVAVEELKNEVRR